jgi:hypothetical protein
LSEEGGRKESILRRRKSTDVDSEREDGAMSFLKRNERRRHMGRRVAGVGVGVAMMVLGLQAPAMANTTVTAVSPTSGPTDCVVDITGTGFSTFPDGSNTLTFVAPSGGVDVDAIDWFSLSDTEIWAAVPTGLVAGTTYSVELTQPSGTITAGGSFLSTGATSPGGCAPTIASFTPTCGSAGDIVTITGTNLLSEANGLSGGDVLFAPYAAAATQPVPDLSEPTSIQAIVPSDVADGLIQVDTGIGTPVFSTVAFLTPPPDCVTTGNEHARSISFKITKAGKTSGVVKSTEDPAFTDCVAAVPVKIQRKKNGAWKTVGKTTTNDSGAYTKKVKNPKGTQKFRALAPKVSLGDPVTDVCLKARSAVRKK